MRASAGTHEARDDFLAVEAELDHLERDGAPQGGLLLREVDRTHAALAQGVEDLEGTDGRGAALRLVQWSPLLEGLDGVKRRAKTRCMLRLLGAQLLQHRLLGWYRVQYSLQ